MRLFVNYKKFSGQKFNGQKYTPPPPPKVIYIDVDKTLINPIGAVNTRIVDWAKSKHAEGFDLVIWSSRGTDHAINAANKSGLQDIILAAISKPGFIIDDQGWGWIKYTRWIKNETFLETE